MLQLLLSKDWLATRDEILSQIAQDVKAKRGNRILIVPELISHDMERRLCSACGATVSRYAEVLSFSRLAQRVAEYTGNPLKNCIDNGGRIIAMAAAAKQLEGKLKTYAAVYNQPELLQSLVDVVDEFKRCCISSRDLQSAMKNPAIEGLLAEKLEEISLLIGTYDSLCTDPRNQMDYLHSMLEKSDFAENHVFYIDGFPDFTRQNRQIIVCLLEKEADVTVGLNCDELGSRILAFEKAGDTGRELYALAKRNGNNPIVRKLNGRTDSLAKIREHLFQGFVDHSGRLGERLQTGMSDSVYDEVCAVAEKILALVRNGCRYREISVVCAEPASYQPLVSMVFGRCGIPVYQAGMEEVLQKTVLNTVIFALEAALGGFAQKDMLRYIKSVLSPLEPDMADRVENYAVLWGIQGKRWTESWHNHPKGLGEEWDTAAQNALETLESARALVVEPLVRLQSRFRESKNIAQKARILYQFLDEICFAKQLDTLAQKLNASGDNRSAQILNQLWEIVINALEQMHDILGQWDWEVNGFPRLFSLLLSQYKVGTIPPVLDSVIMGPVNTMRCQQEKYLFILGAKEGCLPGYSGSSGLFTDRERTVLKSLVPLTGGAEEGIQAEYAEIYGVFCGATEKIWVSSAGEPSYLYRRLAQMAGREAKLEGVFPAPMTNPVEAGAYFAKFHNKQGAQFAGVGEWYDRVRTSADYRIGQISPENITALYGKQLNLSASQVDRLAECRMSYFLKYGLRAKERKEARVDPAEFGTYVHAVLEKTAQRVKELGGFSQVTLEEVLDIAMSISDDYGQERFSQLESERLAYLFRRNRRELEMVVTELWQEMKVSWFQPEDFEVAFGENGKMPAIRIPNVKIQAVLRGFVDRVDLWRREGNSYFRVVDYKTGKKDFDYCDIYNGVGLQMLLYLFALEKNGQDLLGNNAHAAGVQYFPARAPLLNVDGKVSKQEAEEIRRKEWKRKGLLLNDEEVLQAMEPGENIQRLCCIRKKDGTLSGDLASREQLEILEHFIFAVLADMVNDIASGSVEPNPYTRGTSHNACNFCPYGTICHQQEVAGRRNYKAMSSQRFWEEVERKVKTHG